MSATLCAVDQERRHTPVPGWRRAAARRLAGWACLAVLMSAVAPVVAAPAVPAAAPAPAAPAAGRTWLAGPEGSALTLGDALAQARDGDVIELLPGDYKVAIVLEQRRLTLRGVPGPKPPRLTATGRLTAKALVTVRGGAVTLQNLQLEGARGQDGAAAGVRHEGGVLRIVNCQLFDNEHGVLSLNDEKAELHIDASVVGRAPRVEGGLHHLVNVGRIARLTLTGSRLQQGFEGHMLKTRARENLIAYNFIHDGQRGGASYEIDIAAGGLATVIGNVIGQGADTQNPVLLAFGTEDRMWDQNRLLVAHNTFISYGWTPAWFMRVFRDRLPEGTEVVAVNNLLVGGGLFSLGASGHFEGNRHALRRMLRDVDTYAFELPAGSSLRDSGVDPRNVRGHDLSPKAEFKWPTGTQPLPANPGGWTPGAFQK